MSVRKRKWTTRKGEVKEAWIVAYSQDGKRHIATFKRKKDADAKAQQVGVDIRAGTHTPASRSITVKEAADDWIKTAEVEGREALTIVQYRTHANHIAKRIGKVRLANLTATQVNGFRDDLLATMSRALARKVLTSLKSLLKDAQRRGNVAQNVALAVKRIEPDKRGRRLLKIGEDIPSTDEIRALIAALPGRWRPLFHTAIFAGLRSSELRGAALGGHRPPGQAAPCAPTGRPPQRDRVAEVGGRAPDRAARAGRGQCAARMEGRVPAGRAGAGVPFP
jgi:hypothetical protein